MKILISQRDIRTPPNNFVFDALERSWYTFFKGHFLLPHPNTIEIDTSIDFDCLVISGGPDSVERHLTENNLFAHALALNKPIFGVCHGAFTVNDLTGGVNGRVLGHECSEHAVMLEDFQVTVNSYHSQSIAELGPNMQPVATDLDGNIEAFEHATLPIYGVVWHPERMNNPVLPSTWKKFFNL